MNYDRLVMAVKIATVLFFNERPGAPVESMGDDDWDALIAHIRRLAPKATPEEIKAAIEMSRPGNSARFIQ